MQLNRCSPEVSPPLQYQDAEAVKMTPIQYQRADDVQSDIDSLLSQLPMPMQHEARQVVLQAAQIAAQQAAQDVLERATPHPTNLETRAARGQVPEQQIHPQDTKKLLRTFVSDLHKALLQEKW